MHPARIVGASVLGGTPYSLNDLSRVSDDVAWAAVTHRFVITRSQRDQGTPACKTVRLVSSRPRRAKQSGAAPSTPGSDAWVSRDAWVASATESPGALPPPRMPAGRPGRLAGPRLPACQQRRGELPGARMPLKRLGNR